jgi:uncharacterized protein (TIGR03086 family)
VPVLARIAPGDLVRPTPCHGWDVATLLLHLAEGVDTVTTCLPDEYPCEDPGPLRSPADLRDRCQQMLAAWARAVDDDPAHLVCDWGGVTLPHHVVALVGGLELVVHAWDVARAIDVPLPSAEALASDLLPWTPLLLAETHAFAAPVAAPAGAPALDRLVAATGRDPRWTTTRD